MWTYDAIVIACADVATARAKAATVINLIILFLPLGALTNSLLRV
jgi:hypothetical protein